MLVASFLAFSYKTDHKLTLKKIIFISIHLISASGQKSQQKILRATKHLHKPSLLKTQWKVVSQENTRNWLQLLNPEIQIIEFSFANQFPRSLISSPVFQNHEAKKNNLQHTHTPIWSTPISKTQNSFNFPFFFIKTRST